MTIRLIAGLGNPGAAYARSRHNLGADLLGMIADKYGVVLRHESRFRGDVGRGTIEGCEVRLVFPTEYMNRSGDCVGPLAGFYRIPPEEILVLHDELDLPPGTARFKFGGGHGGHNGLRSIIAALGNSQDFHRLRIGTGKPADKAGGIDFVLGRPAKEEAELIGLAMAAALDAVGLIFTQNMAKAANRLNGFKAARQSGSSENGF